MKRSIPILTLPAAALATVALTAAGPAAAVSAGPPATAASTAKVEIVNTKLGKVLADGRGHTLYMFGKDKNSKSACSGACAQAWPRLTTTAKPKAGAGVTASKLGTTSRSGGVKQVTYNGHPLYGFVKDTGPRQTNGQGIVAFGGKWSTLSAAGRAPAQSAPQNSSPNGY
jgi:predicted lipoprotein with Yx(FWY)xxD motif